MLTDEQKEALVWEELEELYCRLASQTDLDPRETWRLFAANRRYRQELRMTAARLLRERHLPSDREHDVVQDALLMLAVRLQSRAGLGFDPKFGRSRFIGWLRHVVRSQIVDALRKDADSRPRRRRLMRLARETLRNRLETIELRQRINEAIETLPVPERRLLRASLDEGSVLKAARLLGIRRGTAYRLYHTALGRLSRELAFLPAAGQKPHGSPAEPR